ncbi:hypothetical protein WR25_24216 [Diploscapter pachys]|uniref:Peptidase M13 C-terminal domain-containing protein n=1 Tax=Diploscapter pachys TaxID=2018661 RepID=A0A2A2LLD9_9BILA|nr:hypothetical protein WR25_24216 [Diploscapter pachys]
MALPISNGLLLLLLPLSCLCSPRVPPPITPPEISTSPGFIKAAGILQEALNTSVDPCNDFYQFACGKWIANNPIPAEMTGYGRFTETRERVLAELREIFESHEQPQAISMRAVKDIYQSCMDQKKMDLVGARPMIEKIQAFLNWPMVHNVWQESQFDLTSLLIHTISSRDVSVFVNFGPGEDSKNTSRRVLYFDQGDLALGGSTRDYYINKTLYAKQMKAYRSYLIGKVKLFTEDIGLIANESKIAADVDEIIAFETEFAKIIVPDENRRNRTALYNKRKISDLETLMPIIDWQRLLLAVTPFSVHSYIRSDPDIIISELNFLSNMTTLLSSTSPRIITNYVLSRFASSWMTELGTKYEDLQQEFAFAMYGRKKKQPRWKTCVGIAAGELDHASGAMYIRKHFDEDSKNSVMQMIDDLQLAFSKMMEENTWMDEPTKKAALAKASQMIRQIGFPDFELSDERVDEYYKGVEVDPSWSFSEMRESLLKWRVNWALNRLLEKVDRNEFISSSSTVNAFYAPGKNLIAFPAGILQSPFFDKDAPKAFNYGSIGAVIGHEITHAFDDQGRQYDATGMLRDWWSEKTANEFVERAKCIIEQYGKIEVEDTKHKINGIITQAYKSFLQRHGEEKRLPGYENYTNEQLFFIGYAQTWCGHKRTQSRILQLKTDPHAPEFARTNVVLSNLPEFAEVYSCPKGSNMNPTDRCSVW